MIFGKINAEELVRDLLSNEDFLFEYLDQKNLYSQRRKHPVNEMLCNLMAIGKAHLLLDLGFQRHGAAFVGSDLFENFIQVHLHKVLFY